MENNRRFQTRRIWQLVLFMSFLAGSMCSPGQACAGEPGYEWDTNEDFQQVSQVTVTLRGANRQGVVQIFAYLLGRFPGVVEKRSVELHVIPRDKKQCVAVWQLDVRVMDGMDIESQIISIINSLALNSSNAIFYESPFIIVEQDLEMVKLIKGERSSSNDVVFSLLEEDFEPITVEIQDSTPSSANPWLSVPGAGFE